MRKFSKLAGATLVAVCSIAPAKAQAPSAPHAEVEEIVVTARRTGVPVWRVTGPKTTVILIGSIEGVAKETKWDPAALTETLKKANQVMFPGLMQLSGSPFALIG